MCCASLCLFQSEHIYLTCTYIVWVCSFQMVQLVHRYQPFLFLLIYYHNVWLQGGYSHEWRQRSPFGGLVSREVTVYCESGLIHRVHNIVDNVIVTPGKSPLFQCHSAAIQAEDCAFPAIREVFFPQSLRLSPVGKVFTKLFKEMVE